MAEMHNPEYFTMEEADGTTASGSIMPGGPTVIYFQVINQLYLN